MLWVLIPIVAILAWAAVSIAGSRSGDASGSVRAELEEALKRLGDVEQESGRLRRRIEHLEAIATSETYELDRTASRLGHELPEAGGPPPLALDEPLDAGEAGEAGEAEARAAHQARRLRGR